MCKPALVWLVPAVLLFTACHKKVEFAPEDHESITKVTLQIKKAGSAATQSFSWTDADGEGGNPPQIDTIYLMSGSMYQTTLSMFTPDGEDITEEIRLAESESHRFYYSPALHAPLIVSQLDKDVQGITLGLESEWNTTTPAFSFITITLRHYGSGGKSESDTINSPKSATDLEIIFPLKVQ